MASIFTGLAFMHGHIVNKELILALGAPERRAVPGTDTRRSALARDTSRDCGGPAPKKASLVCATPGNCC